MKAEDKRFLAELSAELNEQDTNGQADPRYWVIMDSRWALAAEGSGEELHVLCDDEEYELNNFATSLIENHEHDEKREEEIEEAFALCDSTDELRELIKEFFPDAYPLIGDSELFEARKEVFISPDTGIFLTKKAAEKYLKANRHHFAADAFVYAMTAVRNPEQERLTEIIKNTKWEEL